MRFFSRIRLDERHPDARDAIARISNENPYSDHQWLWHFFPAPKGTPRDFIYRRMEAGPDSRWPRFYVVSGRAPECPDAAWIVDTKPYAPHLERGARLAFEVRVNPVRHEMKELRIEEHEAYLARRRLAGLKVHPRPSRRKVYHDVVMDAKRELKRRADAQRWGDIPADARPPLYELVHDAVRNWFCGPDGGSGIASRHGFAVDTTRLRVDAYRQHRLRRREGEDIRFSTVDLTGELEVSEPETFCEALLYGLGRAKAFGCGLLLVRRIE
jgi:CRISPR system Cascade subunit CasE